MIEKVKVNATRCVCEIKTCKHEWISLAANPPAICPNCKSREWNGPKKVGRPVGVRDTSKIGLPKPRRVRPV